MDCKCVVDCLYLSIVRNLIGGNLKITWSHIDNRIAGQPVLASVGYIILLGTDELIVLGA